MQGKLIQAINAIAEPTKIAYAFPERRCTFGGRSRVPDIAVFRWDRVQLDEFGEPLDDVLIPPNGQLKLYLQIKARTKLQGIQLSLSVQSVFNW